MVETNIKVAMKKYAMADRKGPESAFRRIIRENVILKESNRSSRMDGSGTTMIIRMAMTATAIKISELRVKRASCPANIFCVAISIFFR